MKNNLDFLERRIWYFKPKIKETYYELIKKKDSYHGFIYHYQETDIGYKERIKNEFKKNIF